jgi:ribosomal-protein-alanine N-acetyltransferase
MALMRDQLPNAAECARWAGPNLQFPFLAQDLPRLLHVDQSRCFSMSEPDGPLLGFGQYWPRKEKAAHLGRIIVAPLQRGRGLGRALLRLLPALTRATSG